MLKVQEHRILCFSIGKCSELALASIASDFYYDPVKNVLDYQKCVACLACLSEKICIKICLKINNSLRIKDDLSVKTIKFSPVS